MNKIQIRHSFYLLLTASIWGLAFVAQSVAANYIRPFTFNGIRCIIGGFVLIPAVILLGRKPKEQAEASTLRTDPRPDSGRKDTLLGGFLCGLCLLAGSVLQQFGIEQSTVGKAGFITAFYIVLVPLTGLLFGRKVRALIWLSVILALGGLFLLCIRIEEGFSFERGDLLLLLGAFAFTAHILCIDHFVQKVNGVLLSMEQFFVCGFLSLAVMVLVEKPEMEQILQAGIPLLYAGVMSCGVAYTLQVVGQKDMNPAIASLILSLESVVSALSGWLILHERLSIKEIAGCLLMFIAVALTCLPAPDRKKA